jgi:ABC-type multidrug transport system ATPase subunit
VTVSLPNSQSSAQAASAFAIELRHVTKQFGPTAALCDVSASFAPGRLFLIVGDNGAGKSTLLRIIAGLAPPTRGTVAVFGLTDSAQWKRHIGYMPHESLLYDEMSGLENLRYFAQLYGIYDQARCERVMSDVGLEPKLTQHVAQYSQGMRQRLSLARALVHDPDLLLLDEPFSNVDITSARHMAAQLAAMRDAGKTILVVTHQPQLLEGVADEALYVAAGRIVDRGSWDSDAISQFEASTLRVRIRIGAGGR